MDVEEAGMVVEWIAVDVVGRFLSGQDEDCASLGVGIIRSRCSVMVSRRPRPEKG